MCAARVSSRVRYDSQQLFKLHGGGGGIPKTRVFRSVFIQNKECEKRIGKVMMFSSRVYINLTFEIEEVFLEKTNQKKRL